MILTNTLLSIGFSIVSNFANVVPIPPEQLPTRVEDCQQVGVILPPLVWSFDLGLIHKRGTFFHISNGAVFIYRSAGSYAGAQYPEEIPRFTGLASLSTNQVVELATRTVERLVKKGPNPIAGLPPKVFHEGNEEYRGDGKKSEFYGKIPFYTVTWPDRTRMAGFETAALVEIDARNGSITQVQLWDEAFEDQALLQVISNRVYLPDPPKADAGARAPAVLPHLPPPATNEVQRGIESWHWLCRQLSVPLGPATNLAAVNWEWDKTYMYTNQFLPGVPVSFIVRFTNGACFCAVRGAVANILSMGPEPSAVPKGTVKYRWQDLCNGFEQALVEKLGIPRQCFAAYRPIPPTVPHEGSRYHGEAYPPPPEVGRRGYKIVRVEWTDAKEGWPIGGFVPRFHADFDLETGALVHVAIVDPDMVEALGRAQGRVLDYRFLEDTNFLSHGKHR